MARFSGSDRLDVLKAATKRFSNAADDAERARNLKNLINDVGTPQTDLERALVTAIDAIAKARFPKAWAAVS